MTENHDLVSRHAERVAQIPVRGSSIAVQSAFSWLASAGAEPTPIERQDVDADGPQIGVVLRSSGRGAVPRLAVAEEDPHPRRITRGGGNDPGAKPDRILRRNDDHPIWQME